MSATPVGTSLSVLRHRPFRLFWTGSLISGCGVWVQNLALGWLILQLSNSSLLLGFYGFASLAPTLVLLLVGGTLADRMSRRQILIITQCALMLIALALSVLTYLDLLAWWHVLAMAALTGAALAMNSPAYQAMIPDLVPRDDLTRAIALNSVQFNLGRIIGHAAAGTLIVAVGAAGCFLLNALSYLAMLYALLRISVPSRHRAADAKPFLERAKEGLVCVRQQEALLPLILLVGCISLFGLPYFFLLPSFAHDVLGAGAWGLGYLTASVSVGALAGGLTLPRIAARWDKRAIAITAALLFWIVLIAFALSRSYWLSVGLLVVLGFVLVLTIASVNNLLQVLVAPEMRGRVMSIHALAVNGPVPLGSVIAGAAAQTLSTPLAVAAMGAIGLAVTAAVTSCLRRRDATGKAGRWKSSARRPAVEQPCIE